MWSFLDLHATHFNGSGQTRVSDLDRIAAQASAVLVNPTGSIRMPDQTPPLAGGSWRGMCQASRSWEAWLFPPIHATTSCLRSE